MIIVVQYWFENLEVWFDGFIIMLNFGNLFELFYVLFDVVCIFVDFLVEFGLCFEIQLDDDEDEEDGEDEVVLGDEGGDDMFKGGVEVVSLDKWCKQGCYIFVIFM